MRKMEDEKRLFRCAEARAGNEPIECVGPTVAEVVFKCDDCTLKKLRRCNGPVEVTPPKPTKLKRGGRKPTPPTTPQEEECRNALSALVVPTRPDYVSIIRPFYKEIRGAREVGRGWNVISGVLREHGYNVGPCALENAVKKMEAETA